MRKESRLIAPDQSAYIEVDEEAVAKALKQRRKSPLAKLAGATLPLIPFALLGGVDPDLIGVDSPGGPCYTFGDG